MAAAFMTCSLANSAASAAYAQHQQMTHVTTCLVISCKQFSGCLALPTRLKDPSQAGDALLVTVCLLLAGP